ncbi:MAG: polysaccharide biosynthesis protein PslG [Solirubrobacterales bacterium]|jgi:hypothetical protein|nr:polysaccharide biosynthesis protein PslG [Solirubrobacterales bacterium]
MSRHTRAFALALSISCAALLALAAGAQALPAKFWGVVPQATPTAEQLQRLGDGGVESIRVPIEWGSIQKERGAPIDWAGYDGIIERAALAGIDVLPTVSGAPTWAVPSINVQGGGGSKAPARLPVTGIAASGWKSLLTQAAERYGPGGDFWALHPNVPVVPIRTWQIYNEPNFKYFVAKPNPAEYGKLVKISHAALKLADPGAQVLLAGLFARPKGARTASGKHKSLNWWASDFLTQMYRTNPGIKSRFNGVALHPYSKFAREVPGMVEEVRDLLAANKDAAKGLWITELSWSSQAPNPANMFAKGVAGQARELTTAFNALRAKQAKWKIKRLYWFSVDDQKGVCNFCDGSGLFGDGFIPKKSWFSFVKFTGGTP